MPQPRPAPADGLDASPKAPRRLPEGLALGFLLALAAGLRVWNLGAQSLWLDEIYSIERARAIVGQGLHAQLFEGHGPLFFYLLAPLLLLQTGEVLLRLPSVIFGVAMVPVSYLLGKELLSRRVGLFAAAATAISPYAIWYSQEVRYVSLFMLLSGISTLYAYRSVERGSWKETSLYAVSSLLMLFAFVGGVFLVAAQNLWVAGRRPAGPALRRWIVGQLVVVALFVPWLVRAYHMDVTPVDDAEEASAEARDFSIASLEAGHPRPAEPIQLGYGFFIFSAGYSLGPSTQELHRDLSLRPVVRKAHEIAPAILLVAAVVLAGLAAGFGRSRKATALLLLCVLGPVLGTYALASFSNVAYNVRYTSAAFLPSVAIFALGVDRLKERPRAGGIVLAGIAALVLLSLAHYYGSPEYSREDSRGAARLIERMRRPEEPLVVGTTTGPFRFYYPGPFYHWKEVQLVTSPPAASARERRGPERIWVVATRAWQNSGFEDFLRRMQRCYTVERRFDLPGYELLAYRSSPGRREVACSLQPTGPDAGGAALQHGGSGMAPGGLETQAPLGSEPARMPVASGVS